MIEILPIELQLHIFQFLEVPKEKQKKKINSFLIYYKAYSKIRLVSKTFYIYETISRCRFCSGRYQYNIPRYTKCSNCGHVINSKNFVKDFGKIQFLKRTKLLGILGINDLLKSTSINIKRHVEKYKLEQEI
jgi:hypothetical protein